MTRSLRARRTLTAVALALTAAATAASLGLTDDQHSTTEADSIWGIVTPANPTPAPSPTPAAPDADATPQDSIWG